MTNIKVIGTPLYQWEVGRKVQIDTYRNMRVDSVHFSNFGDTEALVVKPKNENGKIVADIPNILLQSGKNIVVYSVNIAEDSTETILDCTFTVRNRAKPADYVYTETEVLTWESLDKRITALENGGGGLPILKGTTAEITPTQVAEAVNKGQNVSIVYINEDGDEGGTFNCFTVLGGAVASTMLVNDGESTVCVQLLGDVQNGEWFVSLTDVPTKEYVDEQIGDLETALDRIIEIQNELIGGDGV